MQVLHAGGEPAGTGFLVGKRLLVTCAHVLGGGPDESPASTVTVVFAHLDGAKRTAQVDPQWWRDPDGADVAFLHLDSPPPAQAQPLALGASPGFGGIG